MSAILFVFKLLKISPEMAKRRKALMGWNKSAIHYSPQLYKVIKAVYQPAGSKIRDYYNLLNIDLDKVIRIKNRNVQQFGNDLILVPPDTVKSHVRPKVDKNSRPIENRQEDRALELNKVY